MDSDNFYVSFVYMRVRCQSNFYNVRCYPLPRIGRIVLKLTRMTKMWFNFGKTWTVKNKKKQKHYANNKCFHKLHHVYDFRKRINRIVLECTIRSVFTFCNERFFFRERIFNHLFKYLLLSRLFRTRLTIGLTLCGSKCCLV